MAREPDRSREPLPLEIMGYRITGLLGQGAGSTIYAARPAHGGQVFALKHVVVREPRDHRYVEQLENEMLVGQKVMHPNLRRPLECKVRKNWRLQAVEAVLIMEMFEGQRLDRAQPRHIPSIISYFIQSAQALHAIHRAGYLHCDTKPNNILIGANGVAKVIDLGQACRIGSKKERIQGTADYMAPEQVRRAEMSVMTDVFNLGATLYWTLCGRPIPTLWTLDRGKNSFLLDRRITTPSELNPMVPENLSNIVMDCIRTNPAKRPADMTELVRRLETVKYGIERHPDRAGLPAQPAEATTPPEQPDSSDAPALPA